MKQNKYEYTTPFGIAHYILLVAVAALCLGMIIYAIYWGPHATPRPAPAPRTTPVPTQCARDTAQAVIEMWVYHPEFVPTKYHTMAMEYIAAPVEFTFHSTCNDTEFTCMAGQPRGECDPCAQHDAIATAMQQHVSDAIASICQASEE